MTSSELTDMFLGELKRYNTTNFKTFETSDLTKEDPTVLKSCSSIVTRFFIFSERHPEIPENDMRLLYYKLNIDRIARYFSEYPSASVDDLLPFQSEIKRFAKKRRDEQNVSK